MARCSWDCIPSSKVRETAPRLPSGHGVAAESAYIVDTPHCLRNGHRIWHLICPRPPLHSTRCRPREALMGMVATGMLGLVDHEDPNTGRCGGRAVFVR